MTETKTFYVREGVNIDAHYRRATYPELLASAKVMYQNGVIPCEKCGHLGTWQHPNGEAAPEPKHTFYRPHGKSSAASSAMATAMIAQAEAQAALELRTEVMALAREIFVLQVSRYDGSSGTYREMARESLRRAKAFLDESRLSADGPYTEPATPKEKP